MKNTKQFILQQAKDSNWVEKTKAKHQNKDWLDLSFKIALKVLRYLRENKISQKELAEKLNFSPQYLSKLLKGKENLTLETICKLQTATSLILIEVPTYHTSTPYQPATAYSDDIHFGKSFTYSTSMQPTNSNLKEKWTFQDVPSDDLYLAV
jgi:transcriptional regulator with XRE-family HTH domain